MKYKVLTYELPKDYKENPHTIIWDYDEIQDDIEADSPEEAEDFAKDYIRENGGDPENYLFKVYKVVYNDLGARELEEI